MPAEEVQHKLREVQDTLSAPADSAEDRADALLRVLHDLRQLEQRQPGSPAVQDLLLQARLEAGVLRNRLWKDAQQLMSRRAFGQTLGQRCRRAEDGLRLLALAQQLDQEGVPALASDLNKARYRLAYLQNAQRQAKAGRRRRLAIYGLLVAVAVGVVVLLSFALGLVQLPPWSAKGPPTATPTPSQPAIPTVARSAAPTPGDTANPATVQVARSPTTAPSDTASPSPPPVTPSPTATPGDTATATSSPRPQPTATPIPSATPTLTPTGTPTARPRRAIPTPSPRPSRTVELIAEPIYPAPALLQPQDVVYFSPGAGYQYTMRWQWAGTLQADEWFDIRVWQQGRPHYGIAWTKQLEYTYNLCIKGSGHFFWSVAVIRGRGGQWLADLSPEANPRRFSSSRNDQWCERNGWSLSSSGP